MASLLDIAPAAEQVPVGADMLAVTGVSAAGIVMLLRRFPEIRALIAGRDVAEDRLLELGGEAIGAIIAAGCGFAGNADAEAKASQYSIDIQADILAAIVRATMPKGVGPFLEKLAAMGITISAGREASATVQATK